MKGDEMFIILILLWLLVIWWPVEDVKITPEAVSFAASNCKDGKWKSIDKKSVICEDGATYELKLGE
tara:strand:- start:18651 stop:18851 length:201 start_codon:yes stop_codon:yes gene_type:complete